MSVPPRAVGRYRVLEELGRGAAATVFRGLDPEGRRVAIKLLHAGSLAREHERRRFEGELQVLLRLRHPGVAALLDAGQEGGAPYLVLEHVEGEPLSARLEREGPLAPRRAAELGVALARALEHCHAQGVLHRDLKPDNVLLRATTGEPVLVDFGLARELEQGLSTSGLTREGTLLGTPGYWAPEQARGELAAVGPRTDVYGLGATLHAALTGAAPRAARTLGEALAELERDPAPPSRARPGVPGALDAIVLRCLQRHPPRRYQGAGDVAAELTRFLQGEAPGVRLGRAWALLPLAGLIAALVGAGLGRGEPAAVSPGAVVATTSSSTVSPPAPEEPPATSWAERLAREGERPQLRPDLLAEARAEVALEAVPSDLSAAEMKRALEPLAATGFPRAQRFLGWHHFKQGDLASAAEVLWRASRPPSPDREAGVVLAVLLARGGPGLPAEHAAARALLQEAERRRPPEEWQGSVRGIAAVAWGHLLQPGDLGRALRLMAMPDPNGRVLEALASSLPTADPVLAAVLRYEGWGGLRPDPDALARLERQAREGMPAARALAVAWLRHAAVVGEPAAREHLRALGLEVPLGDTLDLRDLLAFDRSRAVRRLTDMGEVLRIRALVDGLGLPSTQSGPEQVARLQELAVQYRYLALDLELASTWLNGRGVPTDVRRGLCWMALAALEPREEAPEQSGAPWARVVIGRSLLLGDGCAEDPAAAQGWLESAEVLLRDQAQDRRRVYEVEAGMWLALSVLAGCGRSGAPAEALQRLRATMSEVRAEKELRESLAVRCGAYYERAKALAEGRPPPWRALAQSARREVLARGILETLAAESSPLPNLREDAALWLARARTGQDLGGEVQGGAE